MAADGIMIRAIIPDGNENSDISLNDEIDELPDEIEPSFFGSNNNGETPEFIQDGDETQDTEKKTLI